MAVFRVERTKDYTVMSNYHLKDANLSLKSKGLLSMMLSLPEDWNYSTRGLAAICKEGVDSIGSALKELEICGYIIRNRIRGSDGRITDTEYIIYERPKVNFLNTSLPDTNSPDTDNPYMESSDTKYTAQLITNKQSTNLLNTYGSNTYGSNTYESNTQSFFPSIEGKDGRNEIHTLREQMKQQIDYGQIVTVYKKSQVDEFVEIMMEVAISKSSTIKIGRDAEYPAAFVQERFKQLNSSHIEKVLEGIKENTTRVWNTKAYVMAALFNVPSSIGNHYTMLVNHDMHGA
ncbi:MAG: DUF6017 domain-containing protein [Mobilitalea sp.]